MNTLIVLRMLKPQKSKTRKKQQMIRSLKNQQNCWEEGDTVLCNR